MMIIFSPFWPGERNTYKMETYFVVFWVSRIAGRGFNLWATREAQTLLNLRISQLLLYATLKAEHIPESYVFLDKL